MIYGDTDKSYRKTTHLINRMRYQEKTGTPSRTLHETTEREGAELLEHIRVKSKQILSDHGFDSTGMYQGNDPTYIQSSPVVLPQSDVDSALLTCMEHNGFPDDYEQNFIVYEAPVETVNVAIDDVNVKRQEDNREPGVRRHEHKRKYAHNTSIPRVTLSASHPKTLHI